MKKYESPKVDFTSVRLFEEIANECWSKPELYTIYDPTPSDPDKGYSVAIEDLEKDGLKFEGNCDSAGRAIRKWLDDNYEGIFSDADLSEIFCNLNGARLHQTPYIIKES